MKRIAPQAPNHQRALVAGRELVDYVKRLIAEGNRGRLIIRRPGGEVMMRLPLGSGIAVGGALLLLAPVLTAIGAIAALVAKVQVDIVASDDPR
jgi:hypothetical protein